MIIFKPYCRSFSLATQDRYHINPNHSTRGDKGIKRANLWERVTGRATTIIQNGQKYYVNTASLKNYLFRKVSASGGASKPATVAANYFLVASLNSTFRASAKGEERYQRRGDILNGLETGDELKIGKKFPGSNTDDLVEFFYKAGKKTDNQQGNYFVNPIFK